MKRRGLICTFCSVSLIAAAGCTSIENNGSEEPIDNSPEGIVQKYYRATEDQNIEELNKLTHEESPLSYSNEAVDSIEVHNIERKQIEDIDWRTEAEYESEQESVDSEEVKSMVKQFLNESDAKDYAIVFSHFQYEDVESTHYFHLLKDEDWKIFDIFNEPTV